MKRLTQYIALLICVVLVFASCGDESSSSLSTQSVESETSETINKTEESSESVSETAESKPSETDNSQAPTEKGEFYVYYTEDEVDFSKAPKAEILNYPWGEEYMPYAYGQVIFKKDDGFYIHMYCEESDPQTTIMENGGNVYLDSCLEFFCNYRPKKFSSGSKKYINLEMNSAGVFLANYNGVPIENLTSAKITVESEKTDTYWTVTAHVPIELIQDIYGSVPEGPGSEIKCNFTKCGSGTDIPHYGSWQSLGGNTPNFHQPQYFETVVIAE